MDFLLTSDNSVIYHLFLAALRAIARNSPKHLSQCVAYHWFFLLPHVACHWFFRKERNVLLGLTSRQKLEKRTEKTGKELNVLFLERKRTYRTERKRMECPTLGLPLVFPSSPCGLPLVVSLSPCGLPLVFPPSPCGLPLVAPFLQVAYHWLPGTMVLVALENSLM